jgi:hypothetical protein
MFNVSNATVNQIQNLSHPDTYHFEKFQIDGTHYLGSVRYDDISNQTPFQLYK